MVAGHHKKSRWTAPLGHGGGKAIPKNYVLGWFQDGATTPMASRYISSPLNGLKHLGFGDEDDCSITTPMAFGTTTPPWPLVMERIAWCNQKGYSNLFEEYAFLLFEPTCCQSTIQVGLAEVIYTAFWNFPFIVWV